MFLLAWQNYLPVQLVMVNIALNMHRCVDNIFSFDLFADTSVNQFVSDNLTNGGHYADDAYRSSPYAQKKNTLIIESLNKVSMILEFIVSITCILFTIYFTATITTSSEGELSFNRIHFILILDVFCLC